MKPTQQDIVNLAREAGMAVLPDETLWWAVHQDELEAFTNLLLERFGAGAGGEHAATAHVGWACWGGAQDPNKDTPALTTYEPKFFSQRKRVYTHPSPTDLRAEYLRGLEDAADECRNTAKRLGSEWMAEHCAEAIEALKGKQ